MSSNNDPFIKALMEMDRQISALENTFGKWIAEAPELVAQQIQIAANSVLQTTQTDYIRSLSGRVEGNLFIIELDESDWLSNALESGSPGFDMRDALLNGTKAKSNPNVKTSKAGNRYRVIPLSQTKGKGNTPGTAAGQDFKEKVRQALAKAEFTEATFPKAKQVQSDGTVTQLEGIKGAQPGDVSHGLYRVKKYPDIASHWTKTKGRTKSFVMFRTISDNPDTMKDDSFIHPGFAGFHFFDRALAWATSDNGLPYEFKRLLDEELKK